MPALDEQAQIAAAFTADSSRWSEPCFRKGRLYEKAVETSWNPMIESRSFQTTEPREGMRLIAMCRGDA